MSGHKPWLVLGGALALAACASEDTPSRPSTLPEADQNFIRQSLEEWDLPMQQGPMTLTDARLDGNTVLFRATASEGVRLTPDEQSQCAFRTAMCAEPTMTQIIARADDLRFDYYDAAGAFAFGLSVENCDPIERETPPDPSAVSGGPAAGDAPPAQAEAANESEPAEGPACAIVHERPFGG